MTMFLIVITICLNVLSARADCIETLNVTSNPSGAKVFINGHYLADTPIKLKTTFNTKMMDVLGISYTWETSYLKDGTPMRFPVPATPFEYGKTYKFEFVKDGYPSVTKNIYVDYLDLNGDWVYDLVVDCDFLQDSNNAYNNDMSLNKNRLSSMIIRWAIDSEPRGARIYIRTISNTPDVKNSNETYLSTTPYEETKGFNIPGLTLENSYQVTIEIKITKNGYCDQVKRFNVRQAIDQQEINTFF